MSEKRKRVVLTIQKKLEIINKMEEGSTGTRNLALLYNVGETTIRDIWKKKDKIIQFASSSDSAKGLSKRKAMKMSTYAELDEAMLQWFQQKRAEGTQVSGPICAKQAQFFFTALGLEGDFNASSGWLTRFKQRHGIREIAVQGEKLSGDNKAASEFCKDFQEFIARENLELEQIYNADETGLFWKCLPTKTLAFEAERSAPGYKSSKERITVLCCANGTGSHKIKLGIIGKAKKPRCFKGKEMHNLPVNYFHQKGAWMDRTIFQTWFHNCFVPQVRENLMLKGLPARAVLLLDNAPSHPNERVLRSDDGMIFVKYLPPNVTALIQPMDQGVIAAMKKIYRGSLLQKLIDEGSNLQIFWKQLTVLDAIYEVSKAWRKVKQSTIAKSWKNINPKIENINESDDEEDCSLATLACVLKKTPGCEAVDRENISEWFDVDNTEAGHEMLSESAIVDRVQGKSEEANDSEDDDNTPLIPETVVSHASALQWADGLLDYLEQQEDAPLCDKLVLRKIRSAIYKRQATTMRQKSIQDYFVSK